MPFPLLHIIKYISPEDEGRICPICGYQLKQFSDGIKKLVKCLNCGYNKLIESNIGGQSRYDLPIILVSSFDTKGWYELYQPIDEKLYNTLIEYDWEPEEAVNAVIKDLDLSDAEIKYFMEKIKFLEGTEDGV